jgi:hypothetical protein
MNEFIFLGFHDFAKFWKEVIVYSLAANEVHYIKLFF